MSRHTQYDDRAGILLGQIIATCYEISTQTKADAFFCYSPHVNGIRISIHPNGWRLDDDYENGGVFDITYPEKNSNCSIYFCKDRDGDNYGIKPLQSVYRQLEKLKKQYMEETENEKG